MNFEFYFHKSPYLEMVPNLERTFRKRFFISDGPINLFWLWRNGELKRNAVPMVSRGTTIDGWVEVSEDNEHINAEIIYNSISEMMNHWESDDIALYGIVVQLVKNEDGKELTKLVVRYAEL